MKATLEQIDLLKSYGITPQKTKGNCWRLITFIKEGNGTQGANISERVAMFLEAEKRYVGKKAKYFDGREVVITSITAKDFSEVAATRRTIQENNSTEQPSAFNANYRYCAVRGGSCSSLGLLTLVQD